MDIDFEVIELQDMYKGDTTYYSLLHVVYKIEHFAKFIAFAQLVFRRQT